MFIARHLTTRCLQNRRRHNSLPFCLPRNTFATSDMQAGGKPSDGKGGGGTQTNIVENDDGTLTLTEGAASINFGSKNEVFYNKVQVFNRDLSTAVISMYAEQRLLERKDSEKKKEEGRSWRRPIPTVNHWDSKHNMDLGKELEKEGKEQGIKILEALSATGLRSIRYKKEIPGIQSILVNDIDEAAVEAINRNLLFNGIPKSECIGNLGDATTVMYNHRSREKQFDVVDLDPYGSASIFLDGAVQCVADGGLLAVTCTDLSVLCGSHMDACYSKYGSVPLKGPYCHEMALRIVLADLNRHAARHKRYIVPLFCARIDFYVRLFVRVYESAKECRLASSKISNVYQCTQCDAFALQPLGKLNPKNGHSMPARGPCVGVSCEHCEGAFSVGGPIWNRSMLNRGFATELLSRFTKVSKKRKAPEPIEGENESQDEEQVPEHKPWNPYLTTVPRIRGEVAKALGEVNEVPLFWSLSQICRTLRCKSPGILRMQVAITNAGFKFSQSATNPDSIKTDAPANVIWDIFRQWVKLHPVASKRANDTESIGYKILQKAPTLTPDFETGLTEAKAARKAFQQEYVRYQLNPEKFWGPKSRATGSKKKAKTGQ